MGDELSRISYHLRFPSGKEGIYSSVDQKMVMPVQHVSSSPFSPINRYDTTISYIASQFSIQRLFNNFPKRSDYSIFKSRDKSND